MKQLFIGGISVFMVLSGQAAEPSASAIRWCDGTWDETGAPKGKLLTGNSGWWGDRVKTGVTYVYEMGFEPMAPKDGTGRRLLSGVYQYQGAGGVRATYDADVSADTRVCLSTVGSPAGKPFVAVLDFRKPMMISEIDVLARTTSNGVVRLSFSEDRTNWSAESERKLTRTVNRYRFDPVQRARYVRLAFEGKEGPARIDSVIAWGDSADGKDGYEDLPPVNAGDTMRFPDVTARGIAILPMSTPRLDAACKPKGTTPASVALRMARDEFETRYFAVVNGSASAKTVSIGADGFGAGVSTELMIGGVLQLKKPPKKLSDWDKKQLQTTNDYAVSAVSGQFGVRPFFSGETMPKMRQLRRYFANAGQMARFPRAVPLEPGEGCIVMLRMRTGRTATAGLRTGVLTAGEARLPIRLDVVDLTLPPQPWMVDVWCDFTAQFPFESRRRFLNDVRRYAESGAKSVSAVPVPGSKEAELFREDPQVKANIRGSAWCDLNLLAKVIGAGKFYETNAAQAQAVATCAHAAVDRYRRTGYPLDRLMVLIMDEPNVGNIRSVLEAGSAFKAAEPGVKLFLDPCHWNGYKKRLSTAEEFAAATDAALYRRVVDISVPITPLACMKPLRSLFFAPDRINATYQHPAGCFSATSAYWMHDMGLNGWSYFSYCALHSSDPFDVTKSGHPDMAYTVVYPLEEDVALTPQYEACRECTESIRLIQAVLDAGDAERYKSLRGEFKGMVDRTFDRYATNLPNDKTPTEKSRPDYLAFRDKLLEKYSTDSSASSTADVHVSSAAERGAWFREARFGLFVHWGIYSIPGRGEWSYAYDRYAPGQYEAYAKTFNPTNYNPREWARLAKAAGMKYAVLTSRHHDGFCMFDSHFTDYRITDTPYGRDAVREFLEAFRAEGLKVGLYHSLPDWTHPGYADTESPECLAGGKKLPHVPTAEQYASFTNLVYSHINQLTTEYGRIDLLFLDYTSRTKADLDYFGRDRILEMVYRNQPDILVNDRLSYFKDNCRDFDYYTPEICVPNQPQRVKGREVMWETCATMNDHWGYSRQDENWKTPEAVIAGLVGCVSKNGNLLLNVGPNEMGEIPAGSVGILRALADWNNQNGESVTGCGKSDFAPPHGCIYTQKGNALYCHFLQSPLGDTILPGLKGRIARATLLRTGSEVKLINHWGFELLKPDEQRIRTRGVRPGDVIKIELVR